MAPASGICFPHGLQLKLQPQAALYPKADKLYTAHVERTSRKSGGQSTVVSGRWSAGRPDAVNRNSTQSGSPGFGQCFTRDAA